MLDACQSDCRIAFGAELTADDITVPIATIRGLTDGQIDTIVAVYNRFGSVILDCREQDAPIEDFMALRPLLGGQGPARAHGADEGEDGLLRIDQVREVFDYGGGSDDMFPAHPLHTDGLYGAAPVKIMALQCELEATEGGQTILASGKRVYDFLSSQSDALIEPLFRTDAFTVTSRRIVRSSPVFRQQDGRILISLKPSSYAEVIPHSESAAALQSLQAYIQTPENHAIVRLRRNQIVLSDNFAVLHGRTPLKRAIPRRINRLLFDGSGLLAERLVVGFVPV